MAVTAEIKSNLQEFSKESEKVTKNLYRKNKQYDLKDVREKKSNIKKLQNEHLNAARKVYNDLSLKEKNYRKIQESLQDKSTKQQLADLKKTAAYRVKTTQQIIKFNKDLAALEKKRNREIEESHKRALAIAKEERFNARIEAMKEKYLGKGTVGGAVKEGVEGAKSGDIMGMVGQAGPWAIVLAAVLAVVKNLVDYTNKLNAGFAETQLLAGNLTSAFATLGSGGNSMSKDFDKNIQGMRDAWSNANIEEELFDTAKQAHQSANMISKNMADLGQKTRTLFDDAKSYGKVFGKDTGTMLGDMRDQIRSLNSTVREGSVEWVAANKDIEGGFNKLLSAAEDLQRAPEEMFDSVRNLNSQFVHLGDQTANFLNLSKALSTTKLPPIMREDTIHSVISGFSQISTGMKTMLAGPNKGVFGAQFKFREMMRDRTGQGMLDIAKNYGTTLSKMIGPITGNVVKVARGGEGTEQEKGRAYIAINKIMTDLNMSFEQAAAFLELVADNGESQLDAAKNFTASLKSDQKTTADIVTAVEKMTKDQKGMLEQLQNFLEGLFKKLADSMGWKRKSVSSQFDALRDKVQGGKDVYSEHEMEMLLKMYSINPTNPVFFKQNAFPVAAGSKAPPPQAPADINIIMKTPQSQAELDANRAAFNRAMEAASHMTPNFKE